jgi:hypothetical protein
LGAESGSYDGLCSHLSLQEGVRDATEGLAGEEIEAFDAEIKLKTAEGAGQLVDPRKRVMIKGNMSKGSTSEKIPMQHLRRRLLYRSCIEAPLQDSETC